MDNEGTASLYQLGIIAEAFQVGFFSAVNIQVVGVGRCDNAHIWAQPMERTVELVGFDNHIVAFVRQYVVSAVVL